MALGTYQSIANALASGSYDNFYYFKIATTPTAGLCSLWGQVGSPSSGIICAPTSSGTLYVSHVTGGIIDNNVAPLQRYLVRSSLHMNIGGAMILYDRLVGVSTQLNTTGAKPLNHFALPRYPSGALPCLEVVGSTTNIAVVVRLSGYTNQDGVAGRIGLPYTASTTNLLDKHMTFLPLASGDTAVQQLGSLEVLTAATGGLVNIILMQPLLTQGTFVPNMVSEKDLVLGSTAIREVFDGATIGLAFIGGSANTAFGNFTYVYG